MRAITPADLQLISRRGTSAADLLTTITTVTVIGHPGTISTVTVVGRPPPITTSPVNNPPPPPANNGNPPCLPVAWRTVPQLTINNEVSNPNSPVVTQGTVPGGGKGAGANSGVTVSYGVDLSSYQGGNLASAGLSPSVIAQLRPFLATSLALPTLSGATTIIPARGPTGTAAQSLLGAFPISPALSAADVSNLFSYAYGIAQGRALTGFENLTGGALFLQLPAAAQSVLTDLAYNFGYVSNWPAAMRQALANQDWQTLANLVQQLPGQRGKNDAAMLNSAIAKGALASSGTCS